MNEQSLHDPNLLQDIRMTSTMDDGDSHNHDHNHAYDIMNVLRVAKLIMEDVTASPLKRSMAKKKYEKTIKKLVRGHI